MCRMKSWTQSEIELLVENYNKLTNAELAVLFPNKSPYGIYKKAYKLGLRKSAEMEFKNRSEGVRRSRSFTRGTKEVITTGGYRQVFAPEHCRADAKGYVMEHILVFEKATGVEVPANCCVHHLNGNKLDNRPSNLCLMERGAHTAFHNTGKVKSADTRALISQKAKQRFGDKTKHPSYKAIDVEEMKSMRLAGAKVKDVCDFYGISKRTFYNKMEDKKCSTI